MGPPKRTKRQKLEPEQETVQDANEPVSSVGNEVDIRKNGDSCDMDMGSEGIVPSAASKTITKALSAFLDHCCMFLTVATTEFYTLGRFEQKIPILISGQLGIEHRVESYLSQKGHRVVQRSCYNMDKAALSRAFRTAQNSIQSILQLDDFEVVTSTMMEHLAGLMNDNNAQRLLVLVLATSSRATTISDEIDALVGTKMVEEKPLN